MSQRLPDPVRRQMLSRTGNATAAGVALAVLGPVGTTAAAPPPTAAAPQKRSDGRGYRETEHTRRYYALARF